MATAPIVWADSFMGYSSAQGNRWYGCPAGNPNINNSGGRGSPARGSCIMAGNAGGPYTVTSLPATYSTIIVSFAVSGPPGINSYVLLGGNIFNGTSNPGAISSPIGTTPYRLSPGIWTHVAIRVYFHASAGTIDIWFNEANVLSGSGLNTGGSTNQVLMENWTIGDYIVQASNTSTDLPVGDRAVSLLLPTGAGNYAQFAKTGAATNWQAVSEVPPDDDTSYVSSNTAGQRDSYAMADLPAGAASVAAVVTKLTARKTDAGSRTLNPAFRIGATDYDGTAQSLGTNYQGYSQVYITNPATGLAWTAADVNGLEFGEKLAS